MADLSQIAKNAKKIKEQIAANAGIQKSDVNDKNLSEASKALEGAKQVVQEGGNPQDMDPVELKQLAGQKSEGSPEDLSKQKKIMLSLVSILPSLVGYAFGGAEGGATGAKVSTDAITKIGSQEAEAAKDQRELAQKKELKGMELAQRSEEAKTRSEDRRYDRDERSKDRQAAREQSANTKTGAMVTELRKERLSSPTTKATQEVAVAYNKIQSAAKNSSAAGDLSLIFSYMKILDPGSTVREGEFANAQNAGGIEDRVRNVYNKVKSGERLSDAQRADFVSQAQNLYQAQIDAQNNLDNQYRALAKKHNLDPDDILFTVQANEPEQKKDGAPGTVVKKPGSNPFLPEANAAKKPKTIQQDGHTYILNEQTGEYE